MVYGISDLHLSLDMPDKTMEIFGNNWKDILKDGNEKLLEKIEDEFYE